VSFLGVGLLGVGLGVIETLEPTLIARLAPDAAQGRAMGGLTAARSLGLLLADLLLGALFASHGTVAFLYGAVLAAVAALVIAAQAPQVRHGAVDLG
jgi:MFS family permease